MAIRITHKDFKTAARADVWEAIQRANRDRFFFRELEKFVSARANRTPTTREITWYKAEIQKWLDKVWPPELGND